jgi:hypothetical protein
MVFSLTMKKFYRDQYADRRAANIAYNLNKDEGKLQKLEEEIETITNIDNGRKIKVKKVSKKLKKHEELITTIAHELREIIEFEFDSYRRDIAEPTQVITNFKDALWSHKKSIKDQSLKKHLARLLALMSSNSGPYQKLLVEIKNDIKAVIEVFSRELTGSSSAYSLSVGNVDKLAELIEARELNKKNLDKKVKAFIKQLKEISRKIREYLEKESDGQFQKLDNTFKGNIVVNKWYRIGDRQYKQGKNGHWRVRNMEGKGPSGSKGPGVFVSKNELTKSGIYHYQLLLFIDSYAENLNQILIFVKNRAELSKQVIGQAGYMEHRLIHSLSEMEEKVKRNLAGHTKILQALKLTEKLEEKEFKKTNKKLIADAQTTLGELLTANKTVKKVAAGLALIMVINSGGAIGHAKTKQAAIPDAAEIAQVQVNTREVINKRIQECLYQDITEAKHFPFDVAARTINNADELEHFFPKLVEAIELASNDAGYSDWHAFVEDQNINLTVTITGHASPEGNEIYNLGLSKRRAMHVEEKVQALSARTGIPIENISVNEMGETGAGEILILVGQMVENPTASKESKALYDSMTRSERRALKSLWNKYTNAQKPQKQAKYAEQIFKKLHKNEYADTMVLGHNRKAVILFEFHYTVEQKQEIIKIVSVDPAPPSDDGIVMMHKDKAILPPGLPPHHRPWTKIDLPVRNLRGRRPAMPRKNIPRGESHRKGPIKGMGKGKGRGPAPVRR